MNLVSYIFDELSKQNVAFRLREYNYLMACKHYLNI